MINMLLRSEYKDIEEKTNLTTTKKFIPNVADNSVCYCCGRSQKDLDEFAENLPKEYAAKIEEASARLREKYRTNGSERLDRLLAAKSNEAIDPTNCKKSFRIDQTIIYLDGLEAKVSVCTICKGLFASVVPPIY